MVFSMFLRNPVCSNILREQFKRLAVQSSLPTPMAQRGISSFLPISSITLKKANSTPILDSVRSFRTSAVRLSEEKSHDHARLWVIERATTALLVPLVPIGLLMPNKLVDSLLAILIVAHSFWGMEALVVEYLRVLIVGPLIPKIAMGVVYTLSTIMLGGLFYLNLNDIGMSRAFWKIWRNMKKTGSHGGRQGGGSAGVSSGASSGGSGSVGYQTPPCQGPPPPPPPKC